MKWSDLTTLIVALILGGVFCPGFAQAGQGAVVVTVSPFAQIASRLAGPGAQTHVIIKPGQSPHSYEATPGVLKRIASANLVVMAGLGLDNWTLKMALAAGKSPEDVLDCSEAIDAERLLGFDLGDHDHGSMHGDHDHGGANPHYWLDPTMMVLAARRIAARLAEKYPPEEKAALARRLEDLERDLMALDEEIGRKLSGAKGGFVALHGAWGYFARRYGLDQVGVIEASPGKAASARKMADLANRMKKQGATAVITEPQLNPRLAQVLAAESGARVVMADPIGGVPGRDGYFEMMRFNAEAFAKALAK